MILTIKPVNMYNSILFLLLLILNTTAYCQTDFKYIKAGKLLDTENGRVLRNQVIVIKEGRISDIGNNIAIPTGADIIDLSNNTVLPGLIDCHTHLLAAGKDYEKDIYSFSSSYRSLRAVSHLKTSLNNGFTTVRDLCSEGAGYSDVDLANAVDAGFIIGPRVLASGKGIAATDRYMPLTQFQNWEHELPVGTQYATGVDECKKAVRQQVSRGVKWIKLFADWGSSTFDQDEISAIVKEAQKYSVKVAAHATSKEGIKMSIQAGVNSIEHGDAMDDSLIDLAISKHVFWCPTVMAYEKHGYADKQKYKTLKQAQDKGLKIVCGTDVGSFTWDFNQVEELIFYVQKGGLKPIEAIKTATLNASLLLGRSDLGLIKSGYVADIIAINGDPTEQICSLKEVVFVMKEGKVYKETRHR